MSAWACLNQTLSHSALPAPKCSPPAQAASPLPQYPRTVTYIADEEGVGTAIELCQLILDLVHEVAVTRVAGGTGGINRGDGKGAPCPVSPVQNQQ